MYCRLLPLLLWIVIAAPTRADEAVALEEAFDKGVGPFLRKHCVSCHNADELTSGVRVDHLEARLDDQRHKLWEGIQREVQRGKMPPEDEDQPSADGRKAFLAWIERGLDFARSRPTPKNGGARGGVACIPLAGPLEIERLKRGKASIDRVRSAIDLSTSDPTRQLRIRIIAEGLTTGSKVRITFYQTGGDFLGCMAEAEGVLK